MKYIYITDITLLEIFSAFKWNKKKHSNFYLVLLGSETNYYDTVVKIFVFATFTSKLSAISVYLVIYEHTKRKYIYSSSK